MSSTFGGPAKENSSDVASLSDCFVLSTIRNSPAAFVMSLSPVATLVTVTLGRGLPPTVLTVPAKDLPPVPSEPPPHADMAHSASIETRERKTKRITKRLAFMLSFLVFDETKTSKLNF